MPSIPIPTRGHKGCGGQEGSTVTLSSYLLQPIWLCRMGGQRYARSFLPLHPNSKKQSRGQRTDIFCALPWIPPDQTTTTLNSLPLPPWHQENNHPSDHRRPKLLPHNKVLLRTKQIRINCLRGSLPSTQELRRRSPSHTVNRRQPAPIQCNIPQHSGYQTANPPFFQSPLSFPHSRWLDPSNGRSNRKADNNPIQHSPGNSRNCPQLGIATENWDCQMTMEIISRLM